MQLRRDLPTPSVVLQELQAQVSGAELPPLGVCCFSRQVAPHTGGCGQVTAPRGAVIWNSLCAVLRATHLEDSGAVGGLGSGLRQFHGVPAARGESESQRSARTQRPGGPLPPVMPRQQRCLCAGAGHAWGGADSEPRACLVKYLVKDHTPAGKDARSRCTPAVSPDCSHLLSTLLTYENLAIIPEILLVSSRRRPRVPVPLRLACGAEERRQFLCTGEAARALCLAVLTLPVRFTRLPLAHSLRTQCSAVLPYY